MRSEITKRILADTPPENAREYVRAYGKQRIRGLLCHLLKCRGKEHPATRTVIKVLLPKPIQP